VFSTALLLVVRISPFVAAVASAYLAQQKKILIGISMAVPAAFIVLAVTGIYRLFGKPVDFQDSAGA
jgi:hypothetical protein